MSDYQVTVTGKATIKEHGVDVNLGFVVKKDQEPYFDIPSMNYWNLPQSTTTKIDPDLNPAGYIQAMFASVGDSLKELGFKDVDSDSNVLDFRNLTYQEMSTVQVLLGELILDLINIGVAKAQKKGKSIDANNARGKFRNNKQKRSH